MKARALLREQLEGWQGDLPASWQTVANGVELDFGHSAFDPKARRDEIVIPGRKEAKLSESPGGAHIFHAFEGIPPRNVHAVILGQDPYPKPSWATGRAFEQGNLKEWPENRRLIAPSLRRMVQALANARTGTKAYVRNDAGWETLVQDLKQGRLALESPHELFDHLEGEGVLLLNTSFTVGVDISKGKLTRGHLPLWRPFLERILTSIAGRKNGYTVFLLWGRNACRIVERGGIRAAAKRSGTWENKVTAVAHAHPAAITKAGAVFLKPPNPFLAANQALHRLGGEAIQW